MKLEVSVELNLKTEEVTKAVLDASRLAMRDIVVNVHNDAMHGSPKLTGHNMRSIAGEVSGMGKVADGGEGSEERIVDASKIEGAVFSTSGYGGFLETGTSKMPARPYMKPALDKSFTPEIFAASMKEHLK